MVLMIILAFILAYPLFMVSMYLVARMIFTPLNKLAAEQEREKFILLMKARRVKRTRGLAHA